MYILTTRTDNKTYNKTKQQDIIFKILLANKNEVGKVMRPLMKTYAFSISVIFCYLGYHRSDGLSIVTHTHTHTHNLREKALSKNAANIKAGVMVGSVFAMSIMFQPSIAIAISSDPLEAATINMADAAYPVLTSLGDISSLTNKLVKLGNKISVSKTTGALDKGIDCFLAIPDKGVADFVTRLESSYEGVSVSDNSCTSFIPIPIAPIEEWASSEAVQALDSTKVKALQDKFQAVNQAVPQTVTRIQSSESESGYRNICLPATKEGLETLWIGQTELTLNVPRPEARAFASSASSALQSVPGKEFLNVYPDAKKVFTSNVDKKAVFKFEANAKALEKVIQSDSRFIQRGVKI